jgi:hypothetical protein
MQPVAFAQDVKKLSQIQALTASAPLVYSDKTKILLLSANYVPAAVKFTGTSMPIVIPTTHLNYNFYFKKILTSIANQTHRNIDFYLSRSSPKESLLKIIEDRYNVDRKDMCYFGDDLFDIGIMKEVGYSFCTCDSPLMVKSNSIELNVLGGNNAILHLFEYCEKYCLIPILNYEELISKIYELDKKEKF